MSTGHEQPAPVLACDVSQGSSGDVVALLETAIRLEKDSVLFYNELLPEVDEKDAPAIQEIIEEEKRHVRSLVEAKKRLKS